MTFENICSIVLNNVFRIINPFKKRLVHTRCQVHIFNNAQAVRVLKDFGYDEQYEFFKKNLEDFNDGSVWADQNFKSTAHFYNPKTGRGLFGRGHSKDLVRTYYGEALRFYFTGNTETAMFFLGACTHIIQDLTIPQHVTVRLFDNHRQFEDFVKYTYNLVREYRSNRPPVILPKIDDYVEFNARIALKLDKAYGKLKPLKLRFFKVTLSSLPLAQSTTAGAMLLFWNDMKFIEKRNKKEKA